MSTRRARIKAVTSLPPRRKNNDNVDSKVAQPKDAQKPIKSPLTPKAVSKCNEVIEKAVKSPPGLLPLHNTTSHSKICSPLAKPPLGTPKSTSVLKTPKLAEKVSVITSASSSKSVFASPQPRLDSPLRNIASPLAATQRLTPKSNNFDRVKSVAPIKTETKSREHLELNEPQKIYKAIGEKANSVTSDVPEDYNVPSVPESVTEDAVMDGIVPLQPTRSVPKPIDLLKNEIISENAEVLFDPIVPLPSPSKVRPKLRPVPRLAPLRRNSIQGSASESEDESRRALLGGGVTTPAPPRQRHDSHTSHSTLQSLTNRDLNRIRNDSVSSSISQVAAQPPPATAASPTKEKQHSKSRRQDMSRRMAAMRRRRETVKREALTMYDLIFYNPTTNPIVPDPDEINAKEANKQDELERAQAEDDPDEPPPAGEAPVPQIKLGPNGEIILDETSLLIKQTDSKRKLSSVVREGAWGSGGGKYSRSARTAEWSAAETVRFYRALAALGTDFTLMAPLFPDRNRRDLKIKFKKEEKVNGAQVDKALRSATAWDAVNLQEEFQRERAEAAEQDRRDKERLQRQKQEEVKRLSRARHCHVRRSRAAKAVETAVLPNVPSGNDCKGPITANEIIQHALGKKIEKARKRRELAEAKKLANTPLATITLQSNTPISVPIPHGARDMATLTRVPPKSPPPAPINLNMVSSIPPINLNMVSSIPPINLNMVSSIPPNIESGSLVVLTVNDPHSPSKKMLQTYIAHGAGRLTPVALPSNFLNTVVGYMKKGTPKSNSTGSPQFISPASYGQDRTMTPSVIQVNPSPAKRQRHSSYTFTQL